MVYCTKCGTKNEEGVEYCSKCGANLGVSREQKIERRAKEWGEDFGRRAEEWGEQIGKRAEKECFGLPHGGTIAGLIIGIIIIIVALSWIPGLISPEVREVTEPLFWPVIIIVFGILIVAGALYGLRRRP
jgi:uncharacterized membrane protein YvbJ